MTIMRVNALVELAIFLALIIATEYALMFLPNMSLTPLLLAVYFKNRSFYLSYHLLLVYVILDNLIMASMTIYFVPMFVGWFIWLLFVKWSKNLTQLIMLSFLFATMYGLSFAIFNWVFLGIDFRVYILADIPFQVNMALSNVVTINILFPALDRAFKLNNKED